MSEEDLPSLKGKSEDGYLLDDGDGTNVRRKTWIRFGYVRRYCLDKQIVKKAIYKVTKHEPNKLVIVTDFLKELGLE